jgi:hypothetical protein
MSIDEHQQYLYISEGLQIFKYTFDGKYINTIPVPLVEGQPLERNTYMDKGLFIGYSYNHDGTAKSNYCLFDSEGHVTKCFPNHVRFSRKSVWTSSEGATKPYKIDMDMFVKEYQYDTIFRVADRLEPKYVFKLGRYAMPLNERIHGQVTALQQYINVPAQFNSIVGTPQYVFFPTDFGKVRPTPEGRKHKIIIQGVEHETNSSRYVFGLYDSYSKETKLLETNPVSKLVGLINDIDGGLSFKPQYYISNDELVDIWSAEDMKEFLTQEYFDAHTIKDEQAHQNLKKLLSDMLEDDNPVLVFAKLKKN